MGLRRSRHERISGNRIRDLGTEAEKRAIVEFGVRKAAKIAPGWKDDGSGDYLIWKTLLESNDNKDLILVTFEKKEDLWDGIDGEPLFAKRELVEEYFSASSGREFHLTNLSDFLKLVEADAGTVEAVIAAETTQEEDVGVTPEQEIELSSLRARLAQLKSQIDRARADTQRIKKDISARLR